MSKVILVTGGNRGIGRAIVQRLLETDSTLSCRYATEGAAAVAELEQKRAVGRVVRITVTSDESIASAVKTVQEANVKRKSNWLLIVQAPMTRGTVA